MIGIGQGYAAESLRPCQVHGASHAEPGVQIAGALAAMRKFCRCKRQSLRPVVNNKLSCSGLICTRIGQNANKIVIIYLTMMDKSHTLTFWKVKGYWFGTQENVDAVVAPRSAVHEFDFDGGGAQHIVSLFPEH